MRKISTLAVFLLLAVWCWGQGAPADSAPDGQSSAPSQNQAGRYRRFMGVAGTITAINSDSITVKTRNGQTAQVNLTDKTQYRKERQAAQLSDFKVGDEIVVRGQPAGQGAWQAEMVAERPAGSFGMERFREGLGKQFIAGEIKSIDGTQLTILRPDNVTQTITVDENTSFRKDGQSVTLADLKPGDHVFGRGELKNNVFVPAVLNIGMPGMMMRRGPRGGAGPDTSNPQ
jgi:ribosomal protein L21E